MNPVDELVHSQLRHPVGMRRRGIRRFPRISLRRRETIIAVQCRPEVLATFGSQPERDALMKEAREIREKMINDAKIEAQTQGEKMIEQAKAAMESEKNAAMADLKNQVSSLSLSIAEKILKDELSNKEAQTKIVEKMLDEVKLN